MRNFLKKIIFPFSMIPTILTPIAVISCTDQLRDVKKDITTTDLGYVEDLSSETIRRVFIEKNPKIKEFFVPWPIRGDSHQAVFRMRNGYYDSQQIKITYYSKIDFVDNNQKDYQLTKENNQVVISFRISDTYDETVDPKIMWFFTHSNHKDNTLYISDFIEFSSQIDKAKGSYQVIISLSKNANHSLSASGGVEFHYWAQSFTTLRPAGSVLVSINLAIEI